MIQTRNFGKIGEDTVTCYTLENNYIKAEILDYGGMVRSLTFNGTDIVCGFDDLESYLEDTGYQGAIIGRCANRIANGVFTLNGNEYNLPKNEKGVTHLHGGIKGFDKHIWKAEAEQYSDGNSSLTLKLFSPDGDEGYPGNLEAEVTYTLSGKNLIVNYKVKSDKDTPVNLTNHSYFNLNGYGSGDIYSHVLRINADKYSEVDSHLIPVHEADVGGTVFDFRESKPVGKDIFENNEQLKICGGYDHNYIININSVRRVEGRRLFEAAVLSTDKNTMTVYTDMPCIQLYTGNFMTGSHPFKNGVKQEKNHALCLETQFEPNSLDKGDAILRARKPYNKTTVFSFK